MYNDIINQIYSAVCWNHISCKDYDVVRTATNYGAFDAYAGTLKMMGHKVEGACEIEDSGCLRITYLKLDGQVLLENGEWQKAFWNEFEDKLNK